MEISRSKIQADYLIISKIFSLLLILSFVSVNPSERASSFKFRKRKNPIPTKNMKLQIAIRG
jgi:hypothetical protein